MDQNALIEGYLLGQLDQEQTGRLDRMLAENPELRREFVLSASMDAGMRELAFEKRVEPPQLPRAFSTPYKYLLVAALSIAASLLWVMAFDPGRASSKTVATLASSENAAWESDLPTTPGSQLSAGVLRLRAGVATIEFGSGAEVLLEAPAELELITPMRGKLMSGAAVIDVPEPAIGFVMETPEGYAVDYGTRFAVRVDRQKGASDFELVEGEIAVHHGETGEHVRLVESGRMAVVSQKSLSVGESGEMDEPEFPVAQSGVIRLRTGDAFGSALRRDHKRQKYILREALSVKSSNSGKWDYRSFFSFDLSSVDLDQVRHARLRLNLVPSSRGFASRLPKINRFGVYGVTNADKQKWPKDCLWEQSPGPEDGVLLGTFEVQRSQQRGTFGIHGQVLLDFVNDHPGSEVTFLLVRQTKQIEGVGSGLTHLFASDRNPEAVGPVLELAVD